MKFLSSLQPRSSYLQVKIAFNVLWVYNIVWYTIINILKEPIASIFYILFYSEEGGTEVL
jgi:hypothetical protein